MTRTSTRTCVDCGGKKTMTVGMTSGRPGEKAVPVMQKDCETCAGKGWEEVLPCPECDGSGKNPDDIWPDDPIDCYYCDGDGWMTQEEINQGSRR